MAVSSLVVDLWLFVPYLRVVCPAMPPRLKTVFDKVCFATLTPSGPGGGAACVWLPLVNVAPSLLVSPFPDVSATGVGSTFLF